MKTAAVKYVLGKWMRVRQKAAATCFNSWSVSSKAAITRNGISLCCLFYISQCNSEELVQDSLIKTITRDKQGRVGGTIETDTAD